MLKSTVNRREMGGEAPSCRLSGPLSGIGVMRAKVFISFFGWQLSATPIEMVSQKAGEGSEQRCCCCSTQAACQCGCKTPATPEEDAPTRSFCSCEQLPALPSTPPRVSGGSAVFEHLASGCVSEFIPAAVDAVPAADRGPPPDNLRIRTFVLLI